MPIIGGGFFAGGGGTSYIDGEVETYNDLPTSVSTAPLNSAYLVRKPSGVYLVNRKPAGIYVRNTANGNLADWAYAGDFPDVYSDDNFTLYDGADSSKNLKFQLSGLTTSTTRTLTVPDKDGTIATTSDITSQVNSDWNASSGVAQILNKPSLSAVATSGSASDLSTGTLADARLSANVPLIASANSFTAGQTITAAANTSALTATYSVTGANTTPLLNLSGTWNTTGVVTGLKLNITDTASNTSSLLMDLQVGGSSKLAIKKDGTFATSISAGGAGIFSSAYIQTRYDGWFSFSSNTNPQGAQDVILQRDAAGTLALRNGTNAQLFRLYNTYTDASNYERGFIRWNANVLEIGTEAGGTGTARDVKFIAGSSTLFTGTSGSGINFNSSVSFSQFITNLGSGVAYRTSASDPTTSNIISGYWQIYRNTTTGVVKLWCNNNGTMVSVALA